MDLQLEINWPRFPYPGLRPFRITPEADESLIFRGRNRHRDEVLERLDSSQLVTVVGPSGCGKSSLVKVGVIPVLHAGLLTHAGHDWQAVEMRPGRDPLINLAVAFAKVDAGPEHQMQQEEAVELLSRRRNALGMITERLVGHTQSEEHSSKARRILLLIDQFEEIFSDLASQEKVDQFIRLIIQFFRNPHSQLYLVLTMRTDFISQCANFPGLAEILNKTQYVTPVLPDQGLRAAIEEPAEAYGGKIDEDLVEAIVSDMGVGTGYDADHLPLMQHALLWMWQEACRSSGLPQPPNPESFDAAAGSVVRLTLEQYDSNGRLRGILNRHANDLLSHVVEGPRGPRLAAIAETVFRRLSEKDISGRYKRAPAIAEQVCELAHCTMDELDEVVAPFLASNVSFIEKRDSASTNKILLDISHESLIRQWKKLRAWADMEAEKLRAFRKFVGEAEVWEREQKSPHYLLQGGHYRVFQADWDKDPPTKLWAERYGEDFAKAETYLAACKAADESAIRLVQEQEKAGRTRRRRLSAAAALAFGAVVFSLGVAFQSRGDVSQARSAAAAAMSDRDQAQTARAQAVADSLAAVKSKDEAQFESAKTKYSSLVDKLAQARGVVDEATFNLFAALAEPLLNLGKAGEPSLPEFARDVLLEPLRSLVAKPWAKTIDLKNDRQIRDLVTAGDVGLQFAAIAAIRSSGIDFHRQEGREGWTKPIDLKFPLSTGSANVNGLAIFGRGKRLAVLMGPHLYVGSPAKIAQVWLAADNATEGVRGSEDDPVIVAKVADNEVGAAGTGATAGDQDNQLANTSFSWLASCSRDGRQFIGVDRRGGFWRLSVVESDSRGDQGGSPDKATRDAVLFGRKVQEVGAIVKRSIEPSGEDFVLATADDVAWIGHCLDGGPGRVELKRQNLGRRIVDLEFTKDGLLGVASSTGSTDDRVRYFAKEKGEWVPQSQSTLPDGATLIGFADDHRIWIVGSGLDRAIRVYKLWDSAEKVFGGMAVLPIKKDDDRTTPVGNTPWIAAVADATRLQVHGIVAVKPTEAQLAPVLILARTGLPGAKDPLTKESKRALDAIKPYVGQVGGSEWSAFRIDDPADQQRCDKQLERLVGRLERNLLFRGDPDRPSTLAECQAPTVTASDEEGKLYLNLLEFMSKSAQGGSLPPEVVQAAANMAANDDPLGLRIIALDLGVRCLPLAEAAVLRRALGSHGAIPAWLTLADRGENPHPKCPMPADLEKEVYKKFDGTDLAGIADPRVHEFMAHRYEANGEWARALLLYSYAFDEYADEGFPISAKAVAGRRLDLMSKIDNVDDLIWVWQKTLEHRKSYLAAKSQQSNGTAKTGNKVSSSELLDAVAKEDADEAARAELQRAAVLYRQPAVTAAPKEKE